MTNIITTPAASTAIRRNRVGGLMRGSALTAMIAVGAAMLFLSASPGASALGTSGDGNHDSLVARMHGGGHSHAAMHAHFDKALSQAGASDAQKQQIDAIVKSAMTDEHVDMQRYHASVSQLKALLVADPIDDAAIATVRAGQDKLAVATSRRLTDTAVAVARVLTPAQRVKLGADIDRMLALHGHRQAD
ncbi:MAG: hypothetical protein JWL98_1462 [Xanthomonadaceae bacterium]|nr:hypothetical protein [Xanthomonadaceae bacterium]